MLWPQVGCVPVMRRLHLFLSGSSLSLREMPADHNETGQCALPWEVGIARAATVAVAALRYRTLPAEPPCTDPHAQRCGSYSVVGVLPIPIDGAGLQ